MSNLIVYLVKIIKLKKIQLKTDQITLEVIDYGAIIQKLWVKNAKGNYVNVVVGHEDPGEYIVNNPSFLGACIGQYAGRINQGKFMLEGETYQLDHEGGVHLHGGNSGFHKEYWTIEEIDNGEKPFVTLSFDTSILQSPYPGNLKVHITYQLIESELKITHTATTDATTVINLTNHSYFNLGATIPLNSQLLTLGSDQYLESNDKLIPSGKILEVANTPFDFRQSRQIGEVRMDDVFILDKSKLTAAKIRCNETGIEMQVRTNQPAMVIYTPNNFAAICFETQNCPDAPNQPNFPSAVLRPGETYLNESSFIFSLI